MREEEVAEVCVGSDMRMLETVFQDGVLFRDMTFDEVRANAKI